MVNGLPGVHNTVPSVLPRLYPTPVSQYDPNPQTDTCEVNPDFHHSPSRPANTRTSAKKGKLLTYMLKSMSSTSYKDL